jgi:hypothetical protein
MLDMFSNYVLLCDLADGNWTKQEYSIGPRHNKSLDKANEQGETGNTRTSHHLGVKSNKRHSYKCWQSIIKKI